MSRWMLVGVVTLAMSMSASAQTQSFSSGGLLDRLQGGGVLLHFVMMDQASVQQELHATPQQVQAVKQLGEQQRAQLEGLSQLSQAEVANRLRQVQTTAEAELKKILSAEQYRRLTEISLQQAGPLVGLNRSEVAEVVALTAEQKTELRRLRDGLVAEATEGVQSGRLRQGGLLASIERLRTAKQQADAQAMALLSPDQKAAWSKLQGPPFQGEIQFRPAAAGPGQRLRRFR
jgi:hypothetical protein